jgi:F-type H+-transporting ATPase subunit alpha
MKKVAGGLRLDLASFRELEAFAQLGTELDDATQLRLDRGYRLVELLKQGQYKPMNVFDQILSLYAGTSGHLDKVPVVDVLRWQVEYLEFVREKFPQITSQLEETKDLTDEVRSLMETAIAQFQEIFVPTPVTATL